MDNLTLSDILPELREGSDSSDFEKTAEWRTLLNLTYAVWRVIDATVENEFLKNRIKQSAADILAEYPNALQDNEKRSDLLERVRSISALLSLAQKVSNSREVNFLVLKNEYRKASAFLSQKVAADKPVVIKKQESTSVPFETQKKEENQVRAAFDAAGALSDRQKKILQFFNTRKDDTIKLKDVMQFFPDFTDRTIRNDLRELCMKKMVVRSDGHGQASFYKLRR
ncbi:DeoR family transcriptional regulator [Candidatus Azambacteria bacterium]|nr:DeoR family transcriptional regulator [Candidatus Azambacteria bacterium]